MAPWTRTRPSTDTATTAAAPQNATHPGLGRHHEKDTGRRRFHLGTWLRLNGVDLVTMALMGALGLGICMLPRADVLISLLITREFLRLCATSPQPLVPSDFCGWRSRVSPVRVPPAERNCAYLYALRLSIACRMLRLTPIT
jgi:hypothetical protein